MKRVVVAMVVMVLVGMLLLTGCISKEAPPARVPTTPPVAKTPAASPTAATPVVVATPKVTPTPTTVATPKPPIKIGALWTFTGPIAATGTEAMRGIEMFLEEVGGQVAGRKIEVIKEDDATEPKIALEKVRKLVERDKVHMITGLVHSGVALAIRDYVHTNKVPLIISGMAGAQPLSFEMKSDYVLRTSQINGLHSYAIAHYAYDNLRYKKFVVMAEDYAAGHDYADIFIGIIKEKGGEIVQEIYTPYGATDYAP